MAHAADRYDVQLHNHCFRSNHFHLLVTAPSAAELAAYMPIKAMVVQRRSWGRPIVERAR